MSTAILTNKHFVTALIIAPILAVLAWFAVDKWVSPKPFAAKGGAAYPLAVKPNCRYASGKCGLENGDIKILLSKQPLPGDSHFALALQCNVECDFARWELLDANQQSLQQASIKAPVASNQATPLTPTLSRAASLRFAVGIAGSIYYAETGVSFLQ